MKGAIEQHRKVLRRLARDRRAQVALNESAGPELRKRGEDRLALIDKLIAWRKADIAEARGKS